MLVLGARLSFKEREEVRLSFATGRSLSDAAAGSSS